MFVVTASVLRRGALRYRDSQCTMATIVYGNKTAQQVKERLKKEVAEMKNQFSGFRPGLVVLQVGDRDDSNLYISMKLKAAAEIGINANHIRLPETATENEVREICPKQWTISTDIRRFKEVTSLVLGRFRFPRNAPGLQQ